MTNVTPAYIQQRQRHTHHQLNPVPYYAEYFGHKVHIHPKLLGIISMPVKNNLTIYDELYR